MPSITPQSTSGKSLDYIAGHIRSEERRFDMDCDKIIGECVVLKIRERDWCLMDERTFKDGKHASDWVFGQSLTRGWAMQYQVSPIDSKHIYGWNNSERWKGKRHPSLADWKGDRNHWLSEAHPSVEVEQSTT